MYSKHPFVINVYSTSMANTRTRTYIYLLYGECIEKSMVFFDDWFNGNAWRGMPLDVKKCLIVLYCKRGAKGNQE
jgi:hypothetical protein